MNRLTPEQRAAVRDAVGTVRTTGKESEIKTSNGDIAYAYREVWPHSPGHGFTPTDNVIWSLRALSDGIVAHGAFNNGEALHG
jgi:hypothetical protein